MYKITSFSRFSSSWLSVPELYLFVPFPVFSSHLLLRLPANVWHLPWKSWVVALVVVAVVGPYSAGLYFVDLSDLAFVDLYPVDLCFDLADLYSDPYFGPGSDLGSDPYFGLYFAGPYFDPGSGPYSDLGFDLDSDPGSVDPAFAYEQIPGYNWFLAI